MTAFRRAARGARAKSALRSPIARGPTRLAIVIVAFHASVALGIHLAYQRGASAELVEPTASAVPPAPGAGSGTSAASPGGSSDPTAAARPFAELERRVSDCVEQSAKADAGAESEAALRGRWPAIKKAREQLRQRRIAARAACESSLSPP